MKFYNKSSFKRINRKNLIISICIIILILLLIIIDNMRSIIGMVQTLILKKILL